MAQLVSRRSLAMYAADQLVAKEPIASIAQKISATLIDSGRHDQVDMLLDDIWHELEVRGYAALVNVTTATSLTAELRAVLQKSLQKSLKVSSVTIHEQEDQSLLGGIIIQSSTMRQDRSVRRMLHNLRKG